MHERVVFSGVDAGLLDPHSGDWDAARPALAMLGQFRVPLILCSSRPQAELALLARLWGLDAPMIVENGAAVLVPEGHFPHGVPGAPREGGYHVLALGPGRERLAEELAAVAARAGARIRRVSAMAARERPSLPGSPRLAEASYEYTEPFLVEAEADIVALQREAALRGQRIVRGPRYWHLCGGADKGLAVRTLLALYERAGLPPRTIGLGAWPTDVSLLRAVHRAVLLPGADGTIRPDVAAEVPRAERAAQGGPAGWSDAVIVALLGQQRVRAEGTLARIA